MTLAYHIWHMGPSPWQDVSRTLKILIDLELWPQGQIYRVYNMTLCSGLSFFVLLHSHTLFGTWVYHHGTMCHVHLWPWPFYSFYLVSICINCRTISDLGWAGVIFVVYVYSLEIGNVFFSVPCSSTLIEPSTCNQSDVSEIGKFSIFFFKQ